MALIYAICVWNSKKRNWFYSMYLAQFTQIVIMFVGSSGTEIIANPSFCYMFWTFGETQLLCIGVM